MSLEQPDIALVMTHAQTLVEKEEAARSNADPDQSDESSPQHVSDIVLALTSATGVVRTVRVADGRDS
jgi:hypothetical protein